MSDKDVSYSIVTTRDMLTFKPNNKVVLHLSFANKEILIDEEYKDYKIKFVKFSDVQYGVGK